MVDFLIAFGSGFVIYQVTKSLEWVSVFIASLSVLAVLFFRRQPVILFLVLFAIAGYTYLAYPSADFTYTHYGDIYPSDKIDYFYDQLDRKYINYATLFDKEIEDAPFLWLLFIEGKILQKITGFFNPENTEIIILLTIISRLAALLLLVPLAKLVVGLGEKILPTLFIFSFSTATVAYTQSLKFVAGLPFFIGWLWSFLEYQKKGDKKWLWLHLVFLFFSVFSEQWIIVWLAAFYFLYPLAKWFIGKKINKTDFWFSLGLTFISAVLYWVERYRITAGREAVLAILPYIHRPFLLDIYRPLFAALLLLLLFCFWLKRQNYFSFKGGVFLIFFIIFPVLLGYLVSLINFIKEPLSSADILLRFPQAIVGAILWLGLLVALVKRRKIDDDSLVLLLLILISTLVNFFHLLGIAMQTPPVFWGVAITLLVMLVTRYHKNLWLAVFSVVALIPPALYIFIDYVDGWNRWPILLGIALISLLIYLRQRRYAV